MGKIIAFVSVAIITLMAYSALSGKVGQEDSMSSSEETLDEYDDEHWDNQDDDE